MKRYDSYKDSGVECVGDIPEHWELKKLKYISPKVGVGLVINPSTYYDDEGTIPMLVGKNVLPNKIIPKSASKITEESNEILSNTKVYANDIVTVRVGFPGTSAVVPNELDGCNCASILIIRKGNFNSHFISYCFNSIIGKVQTEQVEYGAAQRQFNLSHVIEFLFPFPPIEEQSYIAEFLISKTAQLDTLIQKKQQMIALLEEEKAAVINEAVTRGLNPDAPVKDSGVEWLGMVPAHWEVKKLKHVVSKVGSGVTPKGGAEVYQTSGVPFLRSQNIHFNGFRLDDVAYISEDIDTEMRHTRVEVGDVLLNITGASIGRCYFTDSSFERGNVNQHVCIIRPLRTVVSTTLLYYILRSEVGQLQIDLQQTGANREGLNFEQLRNFILPIPPFEEQKTIVQKLLKEVEDKNNIIGRVKKEIELMSEYRTALISEAVTGKIDVRDYQPEPLSSPAFA